MAKNSKSLRTFQWQLSQTYIFGMLILAITSSIVTSWQAGNRIKEYMKEEVVELTAALVDGSIIALLLDSPENARIAVEATFKFPNVSYVAVLDRHKDYLIAVGEKTFLSELPQHDEDKMTIHENDDSINFFMPVLVDEANDSVSGIEPGNSILSLLGFVYISMSKKEYKHMRSLIFADNLLVCIGIASFLLIFLLFISKRMTQPLSVLASMMLQKKPGEGGFKVAENMPREVQDISSAFFSMLEKIEARDKTLRDQKQNLAGIVEERTKELIGARDNALAASKAKTSFIANVSHELRTPLQAIIGYGDLMFEAINDNAMREKLRRIMLSAQHLLALIDNILDLSKIESGKTEVRYEIFHITDLIDTVESTVEPLLREDNKLIIENNCHGRYMKSDPIKLTQILLNLLSNANKFMYQGLITFSIKEVDAGASVLFTIKDTGQGIPEDEKEAIFENFYRIKIENSHEQPGTGIGLSLSKQLCEILDGSITVTSEQDKGSKFIVTLPGLINAYAAPPLKKELDSIDEQVPSLNILLAEDNIIVQDILSELLKSMGHTCTVVDNGRAALDCLLSKNSAVDIAILDYRMPEMTGLDVIEHYQKGCDASIPVIILTADVTEATKKEFANYDVTLMTKPVTLDQLLRTIASLRGK